MLEPSQALQNVHRRDLTDWHFADPREHISLQAAENSIAVRGAQFDENVAYHSRAITSNESSFVLSCCLANRRSAAGSTPEASFARSSSQRSRAAFSATAGNVPTERHCSRPP